MRLRSHYGPYVRPIQIRVQKSSRRLAVALAPMATAKPTAPAPHAWAAAFTQILPPRAPRRRRAGAVRASPPSTAGSGDAGELLPARLQPNARQPLWHGGGFSLGVDLGDARTGLAVGRGITQPRPLTVQARNLFIVCCVPAFRWLAILKMGWWFPVGSQAAGPEAGAGAARRSSGAGRNLIQRSSTWGYYQRLGNFGIYYCTVPNSSTFQMCKFAVPASLRRRRTS